MTRKQAEAIAHKMGMEGGLDCFRFYSTFPNVKDPVFRSFVERYNELAEEFSAYLGEEFERHGVEES